MTLWNLIDLLLLGVLLLALFEALYSLRGGFAYRKLFRSHADQAPGDFTPPVSLILPCRGLDPGFERNVESIFEQDYPDLQIVLVTDSRTDPSYEILESIRGRYPERPSQLLVSDRARDRGQKVQNLVAGITHLRKRDEALVFADSDIRPGPLWLRYLISTLEEDPDTVATGFRWYVPQRGGFASILRSAWNSGIATMLNEHDSPFAWGGATALLRSTFDRCRILEHWEGALSDDYALSRAVRMKGCRIRFQPHCLSMSLEDCTLGELMEWSFRQLLITRVYNPRLWWLAVVGQSINTLALWGGASLVVSSLVISAERPAWFAAIPGLMLAVYLLGCWKAWLRLDAVETVFEGTPRFRLRMVTWGPLAALVTTQGLLRSAFSREISWRGIRYRLKGPSRTEILDKRK